MQPALFMHELPQGRNRPFASAIHAKDGGQDRNDARIAAAREKLLPLISEVNKRHIDDYLELFFHSSTPDEFRQGMRKQGGYSASYNQLLGPLMIKLYKQDGGIREAIRAKVGELGISDEAIELYFTDQITNGELAVRALPCMQCLIPVEKREDFIKLSEQVMLDALKRHIGLETRPE